MNARPAPAWILLFAALCTAPAGAYVLQSSVSTVDHRTRIVKWTHPPVDFVADAGTLAGGDGLELVLDALDTWDNVPTALRLGGELYVYTDVPDFNEDNLGIDYGIIGDGINEIVFDETGGVLEALGLDPGSVAGIGITIEDTATQEIVDALLILNGTIPSSPELDLEATTLHELGHIWGLGHTFVGAINTANGAPGSHPIRPAYIPTMYPFTNPENDEYGRTLEFDDLAGISALYPETTYNPPAQTPFVLETGTLAGHVNHQHKVPVTAAHVRAVMDTDPDIQVAGLSGWAGDGSGEFRIAGLPPGRYSLVVEGIDGRDGVTAATIEDDGIGACAVDGFPELTSGISSEVAAGQTVSGYLFNIEKLPLDDDDAVELGPPAGFAFDFAGIDCRRIFLYSNGAIGFHQFEDPDPALTPAGPDLHAFLSRPAARIAPLGLDLDPQGNMDGRVSVTTQPGRMDFIFDAVRVKATGGPASFTTRLFDTGEFRFEYGATPAAEALVGYTAGVFATGGQEPASDLTAFAGGTVPSGRSLAMYQLLTADALADRALHFAKPAADPFPVRNRLIYPWLAHNSFFTLGLAVVSNSPTDCRLRITAYGFDGRPLPVAPPGENPRVVTLAPLTQFVSQIGGLFDFAGGTADGWVLVETDNPDPYGIQGFFLAQSFFDGALDSLDGAVASPETGTTLIFPRFTGGAEEFTEVTVVNPGATDTAIALYVFYEAGAEEIQEAVVGPNGAAVFTLTGDGSAYVLVDATAPVTGFAMNFNLAGSLAGQPARFLWESRGDQVSPYFVWVPEVYASRLDLVNPNDAAASATVALYNSTGQPVGQPVVVPLAGWYNTRLDVTPEVFGFAPEGSADGWIRVTADRPLLGAMTFGDPDFRFIQATLPLLGQPVHFTIHSHLAQGNAGGVDFLTGLALLSLHPANTVTVDVYSPAGSMDYGVETTLGARERGLGLLSEWMPQGPWPRTSGYLAGTASEGMFAYEIFATATEEFYAAVPAQKFFPVQEEAEDADNGWPDYAEPLEFFPLEIRGRLGPEDAGYFLVDLGDGFFDDIEDLFLFTAPRPGWYLFALYPDHRYCDVDLYVFNSTWEIIGDSAFGVPGVEYVEIELAAGTYAVGVSLFDLGWFADGGYHLVVEPDAID
jgi:hypothetical protein